MNGPFITERILAFRQKSLSKYEASILSNIEEHGCHLLHVVERAEDENAAGIDGFSYTVGNFDVCGGPELIVVGLPPRTAQAVLSEASSRIRVGEDLVRGPQSGLVEHVPCLLRPVDAKWTTRVMKSADWYYEHAAFPALQIIFPDLQGRFQGLDGTRDDAGFDGHFRQPLLQPSRPMGELEQALWDMN